MKLTCAAKQIILLEGARQALELDEEQLQYLSQLRKHRSEWELRDKAVDRNNNTKPQPPQTTTTTTATTVTTTASASTSTTAAKVQQHHSNNTYDDDDEEVNNNNSSSWETVTLRGVRVQVQAGVTCSDDDPSLCADLSEFASSPPNWQSTVDKQWPDDVNTTGSKSYWERHCASIYGNDFTVAEPYELPLQSTGSFVRVFRSTVKKGDRKHYGTKRQDNTPAVIIDTRNAVITPSKIDMAGGGEPMEQVMNRPEEQEFPKSLDSGALSFEVDEVNTTNPMLKNLHEIPATLRPLWQKVELIDIINKEVDVVDVNRPTLAVIRYEYANLYHQATDWYSAWFQNPGASL